MVFVFIVSFMTMRRKLVNEIIKLEFLCLKVIKNVFLLTNNNQIINTKPKYIISLIQTN